MNKFFKYAVVIIFILTTSFSYADCFLVVGPNIVNISGLNTSRLLRALYKYATPVGSKAYCPSTPTLELKYAKGIYQESQNKYFKYINGRYMHIDLSKTTLDTTEYNRVNGENTAENAICEEFHKFEHLTEQLTPIGLGLKFHSH